MTHRVFVGPSSDLERGLDWLGELPRGTAFVKPNLTFPEYRPGVTTNPELLEQVLVQLKRRVGHVIVGESDGGNHSFKADDAFRGHGLDVMCRRLGVRLVNLSDRRQRLHSDVFINVPVMKVHAMTTVSLGLKNLWGCNTDTMRLLQHHDLPRALTALAASLRPRLTIIDATWALDEHGPLWGKPVNLETVIIGDNVVATDAVACRLMGFHPERIEHIRYAAQAGIGDWTDLTVSEGWLECARRFGVAYSPNWHTPPQCQDGRRRWPGASRRSGRGKWGWLYEEDDYD
jgi:uncharacterized protein (DUF362 family)